MSCGECENSRVEQMGRGREMLFCAKARRFVGASLPSGSGKAVLGYGTGPAWCERCGGDSLPQSASLTAPSSDGAKGRQDGKGEKRWIR